MKRNLAAAVFLLWPAMGPAQTMFVERDGLIVIEAENADALGAGWVVGPDDSPTSPDIDDAGGAAGGRFIVWEGDSSLNRPGNGVTTYFIDIGNVGTYRFVWRNQVGRGDNTTEHNDTWLKIEADAFYGFRSRDDSTVCPKGFDPVLNDCEGGAPNGSGRDGWFKIYSSGAVSWRWQARTSDNDAHDIFARFDSPGIYAFLISGRSTSHVIDRIVLYGIDDPPADPTSLSLPESERVLLELLFADGFE
jgi:hypothetical protein